MAEEIQMASEVGLAEILFSQKAFFGAGKTFDVNLRIKKLKTLRKLVESKEKEIALALYSDFKKPEFETYVTETALILSELDSP